MGTPKLPGKDSVRRNSDGREGDEYGLGSVLHRSRSFGAWKDAHDAQMERQLKAVGYDVETEDE